nr:(-)-alpha-terpineol synthase-like [Ipomoea trifida]
MAEQFSNCQSDGDLEVSRGTVGIIMLNLQLGLAFASSRRHGNTMSYRILQVNTLEKSSNRASELKEVVGKMVEEKMDPLKKLGLVDLLQRLGVFYHFDDEIQHVLEHMNTSFCCNGGGGFSSLCERKCEHFNYEEATSTNYRWSASLKWRGFRLKPGGPPASKWRGFKRKSGGSQASKWREAKAIGGQPAV